MKVFSRILAVLALLCAPALLLSPGAVAQTYAYQNPTYIPTAINPPQTFTATGDYDFVANGVGGASVTIKSLTGTLVAAVQGANDSPDITDANATWSTLKVVPAAGGVPVTSLSANGTWVFNTAGFSRFRLHITTLSGSPKTVTIQAAATPAPAIAAAYVADVCQSPAVAKSSAIINVGATTTTKIVDTSSTTVVYVCGFTATLAGTTPTVVFKTGTHGSADCDTSTASLTGTFAPVTGSVISLGGSGTIMQSIAGGQICATTTGTGSSFQGVLTYVQQ